VLAGKFDPNGIRTRVTPNNFLLLSVSVHSIGEKVEGDKFGLPKTGLDSTTLSTTRYMAFLFESPKSKHFIAGFYDQDGKRRNRSTGIEKKSSNRKEALKIAESYEAAWRGKMTMRQVQSVLGDAMKFVSGEDKLALSLADFIKEWTEGRSAEWSKSSLDRAETVLRGFTKHLGDRASLPLRDISKVDIMAFRNAEAKRLASSTCNWEIKLLKMVFRSAKRDGYIVDDPSEFVETVRRDRSVTARRPFKVDELKAILSVCDPEWRSMILFSIYTGGQRLSDVASLTWSNVDIARKEIRFETRKTGRRVILPLVGPLLRHAEALPTSDDLSAPVHPRAFETFNKQGRSAALSNQFDDILSKAGLKVAKTHSKQKQGRDRKRESGSIGFHALRITATTLMHDAGIPAATVQAIVGHESEDVHRVYVKIGRESQERALNALPSIL